VEKLALLFLGEECSEPFFYVQNAAVRRTSPTRVSFLMGTEPLNLIGISRRSAHRFGDFPWPLGRKAPLTLAELEKHRSQSQRDRSCFARDVPLTLA